MRYLSVCSGIEAATTAWHEFGWEPVAFSEIEPFPSAVLKHHYPDVPNLGDMTKFKEWDIGTIDLLVGGTPCQSFSVAGLRKGLEDPRGNLALTYVGILDKFRPKWFIWENVPGVLSSGSGRDFGSFLGALGQIGYGFAYRVLDAQYFGVAQRRRRVFVVGCLGDWRSAAAVLFERESLSGNPAPSREKREEVAKCITRGIAQRFDAETETMIPSYVGNAEGGAKEVPFLTCHNIGGTAGISNQTPLVNHPIDLAENTIGRQPMNGGNGDGFTVGGPMYTLNATGVHGVAQPMVLMDQGGSVMNVMQDGTVGTLRRETHGHEPVVLHGVAQAIDYEYNAHGIDEPTGPLLKGSFTGGGHPLPAVMQPVTAAFKGGQGSGAGGIGYSEHVAPTLPASDGGNRTPTLLNGMAVRRLTPVECERLQGFPDNYTNIPWRKQPESPDGPRYKSLGNSMAVPVMKWIGKRIANAS